MAVYEFDDRESFREAAEKEFAEELGRCDDLEAEVERLRKALKEISEKAFPCPGPHYIAHIQALKSTADKAIDAAEDNHE